MNTSGSDTINDGNCIDRVRVGATTNILGPSPSKLSNRQAEDIFKRQKATTSTQRRSKTQISLMHMRMPTSRRSTITPTPHRCYLTAAGRFLTPSIPSGSRDAIVNPTRGVPYRVVLAPASSLSSPGPGLTPRFLHGRLLT